MGHLIIDSTPLELFTWVDPDIGLPGWDVLTDNPFGISTHNDEYAAAQNYFAEYHLEYHRQRFFGKHPSRLHSLLLFATRIDAENFREAHPQRIHGKELVCAQSKGSYIVSFHDASFLDYLRLPHNLGMDELNEISKAYWSGAVSEEWNLQFMEEFWWETPIIEAVFQGSLSTSLLPVSPRQKALPHY